jgi:para-nitrobenzyl esterase
MTVVATRSGRVGGATENGLHVFRGIPYAQPPVGVLRFAAPVVHDAWSGVRDATEFGPPPPQPLRLSSSDEWLTVNVWTPDVHASGLPVMVWLYGGKLTTGSSDDPTFDGSLLAAQGVVVVTLNYRVAAEGFLLIGGERQPIAGCSTRSPRCSGSATTSPASAVNRRTSRCSGSPRARAR